jgi:hypothetical protein
MQSLPETAERKVKAPGGPFPQRQLLNPNIR